MLQVSNKRRLLKVNRYPKIVGFNLKCRQDWCIATAKQRQYIDSPIESPTNSTLQFASYAGQVWCKVERKFIDTYSYHANLASGEHVADKVTWKLRQKLRKQAIRQAQHDNTLARLEAKAQAKKA